MQQIFEENQADILRGAIIWIPMLETDSLDAANQRERAFSDPRLVQFWDTDRKFGQVLAGTLALKTPIAWDVYLVYASGGIWDADLPPAPALWMHQLDEEPSLRLNSLRLKQYVQSLLEGKAVQ